MYCIIIDNNIIIITFIIVMKRACLTCFDCCSEIGDKVSFLFLNVLARTFVWFDLSDTGLERVPRRFPGVSQARVHGREVGGGGLVGMSEVKAVPLC